MWEMFSPQFLIWLQLSYAWDLSSVKKLIVNLVGRLNAWMWHLGNINNPFRHLVGLAAWPGCTLGCTYKVIAMVICLYMFTCQFAPGSALCTPQL